MDVEVLDPQSVKQFSRDMFEKYEMIITTMNDKKKSVLFERLNHLYTGNNNLKLIILGRFMDELDIERDLGPTSSEMLKKTS